MANNNNDLFDDCFTGDELRELEFVATQAECHVDKQPTYNNRILKNLPPQATVSNSKDPCFKNEFSSMKKADDNNAKHLNKMLDEKSGEIRLLRDKVRDVERQLNAERQAKLAEEKRRRDDNSKHEMDLAKKSEVFQDRLDFKQTELQEAYQTIKNFEAKVKCLSASSKCSQPKQKVGFHDEEQPAKKPKLVKPEAPCVFVSIKRENLNASFVQEVKKNNVEIKQKISSPCWNLSRTAKHGTRKTSLFLPTQKIAFYKFLAGFPSDSAVHETMLRLLEAQTNYPSMLEDAKLIASFAIGNLHSQISHDTNSSVTTYQSNAKSNCFCAPQESLDCISILLHVVNGLDRCIKMDDLVFVLDHCISFPEVQTAVLEVLGVLLEKSKSGSGLIVPFIKKLNPTPLNHAKIAFIHKCIPHSALVEQIVRQSEEESLLSKICKLIQSDSNSALTVPETLQLFATMMGKCDTLLLHHNCFHFIFQVIVTCLLKLFENNESDCLLLQGINSLHVCISLFPACLSGLLRKHPRLILQIFQFFENQPKSSWKDHMKSLLSQ